MPRALIDTTVLFAAAYRRDGTHDEALPILVGIDTADLPAVVILEYVLAETLNGLMTHAGHDAAVDFLDRIAENTRFHIDSLTADEFAAAKALFRQYERFSFVDASIVS
ncbi:PIN domain-containing protein [Natronobiforma cellulositropha]